MTGNATKIDLGASAPDEIPGGFFSGVEDRLLLLQQLAGKAKEATKADLETIGKRAAAMKSLVSQDTEVLAKHKIEVHFEKGRTTKDAFAGVLVVFQTGVLSGGGDEILYPCPDDSCFGYIAFDNRTQTGETVCPKCNKVWMENQLSEIRGYKRDINGWAEVIAKTFRALDNHADIFLKTHFGDLRKAAIKETLRERRGDDLYDARKRIVLRYALTAILKDTVSSSLESRIKGLLRA